MDKKTGELYDRLLDYVFKYILSDGDGRLECEGMLVKLLDSVKKDCAKIAEQITNNMSGYYDFIKENWEEFKGGEYSDREILSSFIAKAISED